MQFFRVKTPETVIDELEQLAHPVGDERTPLHAALGRVLAADIKAPADLPDFNRAIMDGYAVHARDTFGASNSMPAYLNIVGEVQMGEMASVPISPGTAIHVATGSMLPEGADAVVMIEHTDKVDETLVEVHRAVAPWENVVRIGEDTHKGELLLHKGQRLRPQDIGALAGLGVLSVSTYRHVKIGIISTGDEIIPPDQSPAPGQIRDINSYSLAGLVTQTGAVPVLYGLVKDNIEELSDKVTEAVEATDIVLISGGSSVGTRDVTLQVIESIEGADILVHGVSIRPGKPVIGAVIKDRFMFGLPGNPVSVMVVFERLVKPLITRLSGRNQLPPVQTIRARLNRNVSSDAGREDHVRVKLTPTDSELTAEPVLGKSALITTMVRADGVFVIPTGVEGIEAGEFVDVQLF